MWTRLANQKEWYDYQVANMPPWNVRVEGEPTEYPCLVSTEVPTTDLMRHIFIYENDLKEMVALIRAKDPANLQIIMAPNLTTEGVDNIDIDLLVDGREKRFMHTIKQIIEQNKEKHPNALDVSEKLGVSLEEGLEIMIKLIKRGFINMSTSPMIISPVEQQMFSSLMSQCIKEKQATFSIGDLHDQTGAPREFLATILLSMHNKGMLICKNNRII